MIIGLGSKSGVGKDTAGFFLQKRIYEETGKTFIIVKFADAVKEFVSIMTNIPLRELENTTVKNMYLPIWGKTVRELMYELATDVCRTYNNDFWLNIIKQKYNPANCDWIITDLRFQNELKWINEVGYSIRLARNNTTLINHISETELDNSAEFSYYIENNTSLNDLYISLDYILQDIKLY